MLDINWGSRRRGLSRRQALRVGTLAPLGLSLASLLQSEASAVEAAPRPRAKNVILVFLGGGLSHHDTFDLKPEAPEEVRGKYSGIASNVSGLQVGQLLPKMAQTMNRLTLVRSGSHHNDHHETATNWVLSGRFGSPFGDYPAIGAVVAHEVGFQSVLPPYVAIPKNPSFTWELGKSAYLGGRYESFKTGDPNVENFQVRDVALKNALPNDRRERRQRLLQAVDTLAERVEGSDQLATFDDYHSRAATMILSSEARSAFAIDEEEAALRERYGRNTFGQSCLLARRLIERGVRFATVNYGGWDHHKDIFPGLDKKLPEFDQGFSALIEDMDARGLLDETIVLAMGEFGRTPVINKDAGRDHWGRAGSMLWAGPGIGRGQVIGSTDKLGASVTSRPVAPADVATTLLESLGIASRKPLHTADGRPIDILAEGEFLHELFS
jgi:hypothetical protein